RMPVRHATCRLGGRRRESPMRQRSSRPRAAGKRRRERTGLVLEPLEDRLTPTSIDMTAIATAPYGVQQWGTVLNGGAGFAVTDVGDVNGDSFDDFIVGAPSVVFTNGQIGLSNQ